MAENFDLEELVHLEQSFYDSGYTDGFAHGHIHGLIEGHALGQEKGFEIWEEIGFYEGFARTWQAISESDASVHQRNQLSERAAHHVSHLLDLVSRFPTTNPSNRTVTPGESASSTSEDELDLGRLQSQMRPRYKALCASLRVGVRATLRGPGRRAPDARTVVDSETCDSLS